MEWPLDTQQTFTVSISAFSAAIAFGSAVGTIWLARKNLRRELKNQEISLRNLQREFVNQRLTLVSARLKYFEDFRRWADEALNVLSEALHLCDLDPLQLKGESFFDRRHRLQIALSAMIDRGRWFFPNLEVDEHGAQKEQGYRGYRHELLDGLVHAYGCLRKLDYRNRENNRSVHSELSEAKRHFVGQVQKIIDPARQRQEFDQIHSHVAEGSRNE